MDELERRVLVNLVALRKKAGLSQKQVDEALNTRLNTIYDIEKGRLKLPFTTAVKLTELYRCQLESLITESTIEGHVAQAEEKLISSHQPLVSLGVIAGALHPLTEYIAADPVIISEVGIGAVGKKPLMVLLLDQLTEVQRRHFVLDLYRYINSLISADGEIHEAEINLRDTLIEQAQVALNDTEKKSISRAFYKPFFGRSMAKSLPRDAYRHFLIWTLHLLSRSDGHVHFKATEYIRQVAEHIELPVSALRYIEEQVAIAYHEKD